MAQKQIEERLELMDVEMSDFWKELARLPAIEESLANIARSVEILTTRSEEQRRRPKETTRPSRSVKTTRRRSERQLTTPKCSMTGKVTMKET